MALEQNLLTLSAPANVDLSAKQFYCVTLTSGGKLALATAGKACDGVVQGKPVANEAGEYAYSGVTKVAVSTGQTLVIGDVLEIDTGGSVIVHASGIVVGKALDAVTSSAAGTIITMRLLPSNALFA